MDEALAAYAQSRATAEGAASYRTKYDDQWHKRVSQRRERRLLAELLARVGRCDEALDMPCGAGRLSPLLAPHARRIVEADYSESMLAVCGQVDLGPGVERELRRVNALALPFDDDRFDLVFSIRLAHHIGDEADRLRYFRELFRVGRRHVLSTHFDHGSPKNLLRRLRSRALGKPPKKTLRLEQVLGVAAEAGFELRESRWLSRLFSGHRFCLFERPSRG